MVNIQHHKNLKPYNTFGIEAYAQNFIEYREPKDIKQIIDEGYFNDKQPFIILGGGSNQLFTRDFEGVVIHPVNQGIAIENDTAEHTFVKVGAGVEWDHFVHFAVKRNLGGIENLSHIPGNVGAAPVQNIGAYGAEAADTIHQVHAISLIDGSEKNFSAKDCQFGYRDSIFKHQQKHKYLVDSVTFKLNKKPVFNIHYGSIQHELEQLGEINLSTIRESIIKIRDSKLPCPEKTGNAGSFFKNPVLPNHQANALKKQFPEMVTYPMDNEQTKIAAGWLIEHCGLKGYVNPKKTAGVHHQQALVIVNLNNATGQDILEVAHKVQASVKEKYNITLQPEVIFI